MFTLCCIDVIIFIDFNVYVSISLSCISDLFLRCAIWVDRTDSKRVSGSFPKKLVMTIQKIFGEEKITLIDCDSVSSDRVVRHTIPETIDMVHRFVIDALPDKTIETL